MDGHDTHEKPEIQCAIYECLDNEDLEVIILCFPSKMTHKCQPLDVLVFSAVERQWKDVCAKYLKKGIPLNRHTVIPAYVEGTWSVMTKDLIKKALKKVGLYPIDCTVFTEQDFAPSKVTSVIVHVPDSFPNNVPLSDLAEATDDNQWPGTDSDDSDFKLSASGNKGQGLGVPADEDMFYELTPEPKQRDSEEVDKSSIPLESNNGLIHQ